MRGFKDAGDSQLRCSQGELIRVHGSGYGNAESGTILLAEDNALQTHSLPLSCRSSNHLLSPTSCSRKNMQELNPQHSYFTPTSNRVALEMTQSICNSGLTSWLGLICSYTNDCNKLCVDLKVEESMFYHPYQKLICNGKINTSYQCPSLQVDDLEISHCATLFSN